MKVYIFILLMLTASLGFTHEITVKDLYGRTVVTPENVTKIAALGPGTLRLLVYAGAQNFVIGREQFEEKLSKSIRPYTYSLPENYKDLPVISAGGPGKMPDIEKLIIADPDVIFATAFTYDQLETISRMTRIPVIGLNYGETGHTDFKKIVDSLRLIGYITHTQSRTQDVMNKMAMLRKDIIQRVQGEPSKSVFMASIAYKGSRGFNSTERQHPSCLMLGVNNIADSIDSQSNHVSIQTETLLKEQPEYIFYDVTGMEALKSNYGKLYGTFAMFKAVKEGKVFSVLPYNWYNSNIENIYLTAYFMGKVMYPDKFRDVDVAHYADEIYNAFLHTNPYAEIYKKNPVYRSMTFEKDGVHFGE